MPLPSSAIVTSSLPRSIRARTMIVPGSRSRNAWVTALLTASLTASLTSASGAPAARRDGGDRVPGDPDAGRLRRELELELGVVLRARDHPARVCTGARIDDAPMPVLTWYETAGFART